MCTLRNLGIVATVVYSQVNSIVPVDAVARDSKTFHLHHVDVPIVRTHVHPLWVKRPGDSSGSTVGRKKVKNKIKKKKWEGGGGEGGRGGGGKGRGREGVVRETARQGKGGRENIVLYDAAQLA